MKGRHFRSGSLSFYADALRAYQVDRREARTKTMHPVEPLYEYDRTAKREAGATVLVGIDEAGRGPLAGPVVVAGVILPLETSKPFQVFDSKALTESRRDELAAQLKACSDVQIAVAVISARRIDEINILQATHEGMRRVATELKASFALVDGLKVPRFPMPAKFVVKGDATSASIAAASIIAKTTRDCILNELDEKYPQYGFASHKGYPTARHLEAIREFGLIDGLYRKSYGPVKEIMGMNE